VKSYSSYESVGSTCEYLTIFTIALSRYINELIVPAAVFWPYDAVI
jgi:hypothetical protein